jgi:hypothetical protein
MKEKVRQRLGLTNFERVMRDMKFKSIMLFTNPYMYETHMQIMSDVLITKNGLLGTVRSAK